MLSEILKIGEESLASGSNPRLSDANFLTKSEKSCDGDSESVFIDNGRRFTASVKKAGEECVRLKPNDLEGIFEAPLKVSLVLPVFSVVVSGIVGDFEVFSVSLTALRRLN